MIVLDASALVDVVLDQPHGSWVLAQIAGEQVCAPAHQPQFTDQRGGNRVTTRVAGVVGVQEDGGVDE